MATLAVVVDDASQFGLHSARRRFLLLISLLVVLILVVGSSLIVCVLFLGDRPVGSGVEFEDPTEATDSKVLVSELYIGSELELCEAVMVARSEVPLIIILDGNIELAEPLRISTELVLVSNSTVEFFKLSGRFEGSTITVGAGGVLDLSGIIVTHTGNTWVAV